MKIIVRYDPPPIPNFSSHAWSAKLDNYEPGDPIGHGQTKEEAIEDLEWQIEDTTMFDKTGGPAFPQSTDFYDGLTVRDWFAGQALSSVIMGTMHDTRENGETIEQMFARKAYLIATAMLVEREKGKGADQ